MAFVDFASWNVNGEVADCGHAAGVKGVHLSCSSGAGKTHTGLGVQAM